ncbi:hypothetical protein [Nitrosomonas aestuarii]|uniref:hypothetical protein n=1 Tax=Nitrosomonas aestuarii TaxID=52441 RepID=UPI000D326819|nr:hypothetical protein [Nitrosomonas aestuarii]PTN11378.1 hypothetical protein C8R11_11048 [Nitrosomonas aestuarii]
MLIYNLISLFRQGVLKSGAVSGKPDIQHTLKTLRYKLFATAGYITKDSRKKIINLAVAMQQREKRLKTESHFPNDWGNKRYCAPPRIICSTAFKKTTTCFNSAYINLLLKQK